jgi:dUTP pyrophosphatase
MSTLYLRPLEKDSLYVTKEIVASPENAGVDLYVPTDVVFAPGERKFVGMGTYAAVVEGEDCAPYWLVPRSSISKTGLMMMNSVGVIDKGYRGELIAALWNTLDKEVRVEKGTRLVQVVSRDMTSFAKVAIVDTLPLSLRGEGGFGSTGR